MRMRDRALQHRKNADQSLLDVIAFGNLFGKILFPDLFMQIHVWASFVFGMIMAWRFTRSPF